MDGADVAQAISLVGTGIDTAGKVTGFFRSLLGNKAAEPEAVAAAHQQVLEVKDALYTAKDMIFAQKDQIAQLVDRIKELEVQLAQRDEHTLESIAPGAFAYVRKDAAEAVKSGPWLCQNCFEDGKQSVFQFKKRDWHFDLFECPRCKAGISIPNGRRMDVLVAPSLNRFDGF